MGATGPYSFRVRQRPGRRHVDGSGLVAAEGPAGDVPLRVMPGTYTVRIPGAAGQARPVTVRPKETATVGF